MTTTLLGRSVAQPRRLIRQTLAIGLLACASGSVLAAEYTIIVLQSLTGPAAFIGAPVKDGMVLAADEINRKQELGAGNTLKVIVADDANDRAQILPLLTRYAADPSVLMILGPTSGGTAVAAANSANDLKLPLITTTNAMDVLKTGPYAGILTQPAQVTIPYIANYTADKLKAKNCALIGVSDNEAYVVLQKGFEAALKAKGANVGSTDLVKIADSDFSALATKISSGKQDCVYVSAPAPQAANIIIQMRQAGLDPKTHIVGHSSLASPQFVQRGGKAVEGVYLMGDWVPGGADDFGRAFNAAFKEKHKADADNWAAIGYGGMRVAASIIRNAGANPTRESVRAAMPKVRDVRVVVGQGSYSVDEQRVPRVGMNVLQVRNGAFVLAPQ